MNETPEVVNSKLEERELAAGKVVSVNTSPSVEGIETRTLPRQHCVAEVTLGGDHDGDGAESRSQKVFIFRVEDLEDRDYQELARRAKEAGVDPTEYMLLATGYDHPGFAAGAFLPDVKQGSDQAWSLPTIGQEGNIPWFEYGVDTGKDAKWTPFDRNTAIAERQFNVGVSNLGAENELTFLGLSRESKTIIKGTFTNAYEVEETADKVDPSTQRKLGKMARLGERIPRFRRRSS